MQEILLGVLKDYGINVALIVFFIWRNDKNFGGVLKRLKEVEDFTRTELVDKLTESNKAMYDQASSNNVLNDTVKDMVKKMDQFEKELGG